MKMDNRITYSTNYKGGCWLLQETGNKETQVVPGCQVVSPKQRRT